MEERVIAVTSAKDEGRFLLEWIAFHKAVGFDEVYIISNDNTDKTPEILPLVGQRFPWVKFILHTVTEKIAPQKQAYRLLKKHLTEIEFEGWVAIIDADEFVYPHGSQSIKRYLGRFEDVDVVFINWRIFGSSGHIQRPKGMVISDYEQCSLEDFHSNKKFKSISRFDPNGTRRIGLHWPFFNEPDKKRFVFSDGAEIDRRIFTEKPYTDHSRIVYDGVELRHYLIKSQEDFKDKIRRGRGSLPKLSARSGARHTDPYFRRMDRNEVHYPIEPSLRGQVQELMMEIYEGAGLEKVAEKGYFGL